MDALDSEKEQLAQIKKWFQENGISLILGVVLGLGGVYGWRGWQEYRVTQAENISAQLAQATAKIDGLEYEAGISLAQAVVDDNVSALYADMARLIIARGRVQQGMLAEAAKALLPLIEKSTSIFHHTARIRLARIYIEQSMYDEAAGLIPGDLPQAYAQRYEELRGDIAYYKGNPKQAREAYQQAIAKAPPAEDIDFLQMKLDDLPTGKE